MTSLVHVTELVDAHVHRDSARFRAITLQIAAAVASRSEQGAARLRELVNRQQAISFVPLLSAKGLFTVSSKLAPLDDMVLSAAVRGSLDRILLEYAQREILMGRGLRPARKLLFTGIPGVGKSMAAGALAHALGLPLFRVALHGVISSHLGETAAKLAQVFEHVRTMPAVYLFDEFDALGADRLSMRDGSASGAEMRRALNSLLQFIEDDESEGFLVAATNHPQVLDRAIFRRFDEMLTFPSLTRDELRMLVDRALAGFDAEVLDYEAIFAARPDFGHSDLCAVLARVCKDHVIAGVPIGTESIVRGIHRRMGAVV